MKKKFARLYDKPWKHLGIALLGLVLAYGFVSLGIDSGRLTAYFIAIVLSIIAIHHIVEAVKGYAKQI